METVTEHPELSEVIKQLKPRIDKGELSTEELREEFEKYLDYGVPAKEAAKTITRHYGTPAKPKPQTGQEHGPPVLLADVQANQQNLTVKARIYSKTERVIQARGEAKTLTTGVLLDGSGAREYAAWQPLEGLEAGDAALVQGAYSKEYRGEVQVNLGDYTVIEKLGPEEAEALPLELPSPPTLAVHEAIEGSRKNVCVEASLVAVKAGSGLVFRDPTTNRVIPPGKSRPSDAKPDLRFMGVIDDGTGSLDFYAGRELTEALLGKSLEECQEWAREAFRAEVVREELEERFLGRVLCIVGDVAVDDGAILWARSVEVWSGDLEAPARALLEQLEAS